MKIVFVVPTDNGYENVHCFEYESKENFYTDLKATVAQAEAKQKEYNLKQNIWLEHRPGWDGRRSKEENDRVLQEWKESQPLIENHGSFVFQKKAFFINEIEENMEVYELEEWFTMKLAEH